MELFSFQRVKVSLVRETVDVNYPIKDIVNDIPATVNSSYKLASLLHALIGNEPRENIVAVYLNGKHNIIAIHNVHIGTINSCQVHPREVFGPAITLGASALVISHNHPSGDPTPSLEDRELTKRIQYAGEVMGIEVLDHLVIGSVRYYSFAEEMSLNYPKV